MYILNFNFPRLLTAVWISCHVQLNDCFPLSRNMLPCHMLLQTIMGSLCNMQTVILSLFSNAISYFIRASLPVLLAKHN
jgi:hypothetical protein